MRRNGNGSVPEAYQPSNPSARVGRDRPWRNDSDHHPAVFNPRARVMPDEPLPLFHQPSPYCFNPCACVRRDRFATWPRHGSPLMPIRFRQRCRGSAGGCACPKSVAPCPATQPREPTAGRRRVPRDRLRASATHQCARPPTSYSHAIRGKDHEAVSDVNSLLFSYSDDTVIYLPARAQSPRSQTQELNRRYAAILRESDAPVAGIARAVRCPIESCSRVIAGQERSNDQTIPVTDA
jgi:hypothetical protein